MLTGADMWTAHRRDPFVDVLPVVAIALIVAQHWLMPALSYDDGILTTGNALATPGAWVITWFSQLMPLVFFAGGAAAAYSLRSKATASANHIPGVVTGAATGWLATRLRRLVMPAVPVVLVWLPLPHLLLALGVPADPVDTVSRLAGRLLWFLALYVLVTALTPVLVRLHRACRGVEVAALAAAAVVVDILRFGFLGGADAIGYANVVFVWVAVYQLGIMYAYGNLRPPRGPRALAVAGTGLTLTAVAVAAGPYPGSMFGMPGEPVSNMNPPTAVLFTIATLQLGLAFALRPAIQQWMRNRAVAHGIEWLSARLLTIYVWHIPALIAVTGVAGVGLGWATPPLLSTEWRQAMPLWLMSLMVVLLVLVRLFSRFEHGAAANVVGHEMPTAPRRQASQIIVGPAPIDQLGLALPQKDQVTGSPHHPEREKLGA